MATTLFAARRKLRPDVFMIAYDELNVTENWARLQSLYPAAKLIEGVRGIQAAYRTSATAATTPWFFAVDADNYLLDASVFAFSPRPAPTEIFVWCALNPINGLNYGNGAIKLFPTSLMRQDRVAPGIDVTLTIGSHTRCIRQSPSEHRFNTTPYNTWRAAFRETVKLSTDVIRGRQVKSAQFLLDVWCSKGADAPFGTHCISGAIAGRDFGRANEHDQAALARINDNDWMQQHYQSNTGCPADRTLTSAGIQS